MPLTVENARGLILGMHVGGFDGMSIRRPPLLPGIPDRMPDGPNRPRAPVGLAGPGKRARAVGPRAASPVAGKRARGGSVSVVART